MGAKYQNDNYDELCLMNPYSKVTTFILYLYTMEFGDPPLYSDINRIIRTKDANELETLGPIVKCISQVVLAGDASKKKEDQVKTGVEIMNSIGGREWNVAGIFLAYRGGQMNT